MRETEKQMKDILSQDVQVSDVVNQRLRDTYKILERKQESSGKQKYFRKNLRIAAAVAAILCCAVPSMVYASVKSGFFEAIFGNTTKKSSDVIHVEVDNGKGGTTAVDIPSKEFVAVDEAKAEGLIGQWVMDEPITREIGDHTLTVENFIYDKNGALMYFTLGCKGGVKALRWDEISNAAKGAVFTEKVDFYFQVECGENGTEDFIFAGNNIYVDTEKSTDELLYCTSYMLWNRTLKEGDAPHLMIAKYPDTLEEINKLMPDTTGMSNEEAKDQSLWKAYDEAMAKTQIENIDLSGKGQIPVKRVDLDEYGYLEYSPIAIAINLDIFKGMGFSEDEAQDLCNLKHLEIKYKDGSSYIISDSENLIENNGYVLGSPEGNKTVFNRLVDTNEIAQIIVNDVSFSVE